MTQASPLERISVPARYPLELLHRAPASDSGRRPPLLFIHGMGHGAWMWDEHWMPAASALGWDCWALSVRGHGESEGREAHWRSTLSSYADDVMSAISVIGTSPVLVGHSMGARIIQKVSSVHPVPAMVYVAPAPFGGGHYQLWMTLRNAPWDLARVLAGIPVQPERRHLVSDAVPRDRGNQLAARCQPGTTLNILQIMAPASEPPAPCPTMLMAAGLDQVVAGRDFERTARRFNSALKIYPNSGHDLMLDVGWEKALDDMLQWVEGAVTAPAA